MLASIIITNYNYERYLAQAIDSALGQTHEDKEVIVVDDGSTDGSARLMARYGDRIRPILKANGGQGSAANAGFASARGELVVFLDSDDMLFPQALASAAAAWEEGLAKVQYPMELVDHDGKPLGTRYPHMLHQGDLGTMVKTWLDFASSPTSGNVFSRNVLERIFPLDESDTRTGLDYHVSCLCAMYGRVKTLPRPLAAYRMHMPADALLANHQYKSPVVHLLRTMKVREAVRSQLVLRGMIAADHEPRTPPYEIRSRMVSLVADPQAYPCPGDTRVRIAAMGTKAAMDWPGYGPGARAVMVVWLWAIALAPRFLSLRIIRWGTNPAARPWPIRMLARLIDTHARRSSSAG